MNVFSLVASLALDSKGYERDLKGAENSAIDFAKNVGGKLGDAVKTVAKVGAAAAAAAGTAITVLTKQVVDSYADYEQLVGGVETLFKGSADQVKQYADEAYRTAGMSANEYMETVTGFSASLIQSLGGDTNQAADLANQAIVDMSDNANKMGTDMESIKTAYAGFAKQNYTMLDNLKLGYGGTKSEMDRLIKDAAKLDSSFKANTKTVTKNGKAVKELDYNYADIVKAIHIVQTNMGITGTTAEEAAKTVSGSLGMLKAAWQNMITGMGEGNEERLDGLVENVVEAAKTAMDNLLPVIEHALDGLAQLIGKLGPVVARELPRLVDRVLPSAVDAAGKLMEGIFAAVPGIIDKGLPVVIRSVTSLFNGLMKALPTLGARFYRYLKEGLLPDIAWAIAEATGGGWDEANSIYHGMTGALDFLVDIFDRVGTGIQAVWDKVIQPVFSDLSKWLVETILPKLAALADAFGNAFANMGAAIDTFMASPAGIWLTDTLATIWDAAKDAIETFIDFLTDILNGDWKKAWSELTGLVERQFGRLLSILTDPINGIIDMVNWMLRNVQNAINGVINQINKLPFVPDVRQVTFAQIDHIGETRNRKGGAGRYMANGGTLYEGQDAIVGEYAPERLRVVGGKAVVTPTGLPRFDGGRPVQIIFEIDGDDAKRWIYNATEDERQRVGVKLTK